LQRDDYYRPNRDQVNDSAIRPLVTLRNDYDLLEFLTSGGVEAIRPTNIELKLVTGSLQPAPLT